MIRVLVCLGLLAGCTTGQLAPEGTDFVRITTVDPSSGRASDTIFANEILKQVVPFANKPDGRVSWSMLPEGSYAQARAIVLRDMPRVTAPRLDLCPADARVHSIVVSPPIADLTVVVGGCHPNGFDALHRDLATLLPPWPRNP